VHEGGHHALTRDSLVLKGVPFVSAWDTNSEEHELITRAHHHTCFHWEVPAHLKDTVGEWQLIDTKNVKDMIAEANKTGLYGGDKWWLKYGASATTALPIMATKV